MIIFKNIIYTVQSVHEEKHLQTDVRTTNYNITTLKTHDFEEDVNYLKKFNNH